MKKLFLLGVIGAWAMGTVASAQLAYTSGHGDIGVGYDAGLKEFEPHWHLHSGAIVEGNALGADTEYAPVDVMAVATALRSSPVGSSGILGVADSSTIFAMGSSTYQPNTGFAVEELVPADWVGDISISLLSWTLPVGAQFALYTTNIPGTNAVDKLFSTFNPAATDSANSFLMTPGDHAHFQWGFTTPGTYELTFQWSGTHVGDGAITTSDTFTVEVVPEPSTVALSSIGLVLAAWGLRRRQPTP